MSEHNEESEQVTESLEAALLRNAAAMSGETESTDSTPPAYEGDDTSSETEVEVEAGTDQESQDALEPPEKWSDEWKDSFRGLSKEAQKILLDRHRDVEAHLTKETQSLSETRKRYEKLDEVLKPYLEALRPRGIDLEPHIANALQYYFSYQQDPLRTVKNLIESAGLSQDQFFDDDSIDPSIRALRTELQEAKREIANLKSQPSQSDSDAQRQLDSFRNAKGDDGALKYPHFEQLKTLMAPLVAEGKSLEESYNEVLWTLPDYRKQQLEQSAKKAKDDLESRRRKKAESAKKASDILPPSNVNTETGLKPAKNWNEALQATLDKLGG